MHFPEHQIRGLLESLIYGLAYMAKKDINHHDFYPTNIYYNNGCFKILNPLMVKYSGYSITQQRKI
jgi:serine/threonine protein kinase